MLWLRPSCCGAVAVLCLVLGLASVAGAAEDAPGGGKEITPKLSDLESATNGLGFWIWAAKTYDRQTCQFWRSFEISSQTPVVHARLLMTVDNEFILFLDGREMGRGAEWRELFDYDVTRLMAPGTHVLAVHAYNSSSYAGMIFGLRIDLADGKIIEVKSDQSWRIVPDGTKGWETRTKALDRWPRATIIGPLGIKPWWTTPEMVIKEALNNAVKHSDATEMVLKIKWQAQKLTVAVSDNGKGFDQTALKPGRNGLANMTQRVRELGGAFLITSQPGKGCRTEFTIPVRQSRWPGWNWRERITGFAEQLNETKGV